MHRDPAGKAILVKASEEVGLDRQAYFLPATAAITPPIAASSSRRRPACARIAACSPWLSTAAPASLIGRVYALYSATLLLFVGGSLLLFYQYQSTRRSTRAQDSATMLIELAAQTVADSAVIGDYDTIKRTLDKSILRSQFDSGLLHRPVGRRQVSQEEPSAGSQAPGWLVGSASPRELRRESQYLGGR